MSPQPHRTIDNSDSLAHLQRPHHLLHHHRQMPHLFLHTPTLSKNKKIQHVTSSRNAMRRVGLRVFASFVVNSSPMLDPKLVRENPQAVRDATRVKRIASPDLVDSWLKADEKRRNSQLQADTLRNEQ